MEEPPRIERIIDSQGISLADTATILKRYISTIDQHHLHHEAPANADDSDDFDEAITEAIDDADAATPARKSRDELMEERLIAQMDQLANAKSSAGTISDDVYERLKMISDSICAEVEGHPLSASVAKKRAARKQSSAIKVEEGAHNNEEGAEEFLADLAEAEEERAEEEKQQQTSQTKRDKKKEKKAKKAAKKAKKEAKRKARESAEGQNAKKIKVED